MGEEQGTRRQFLTEEMWFNPVVFLLSAKSGGMGLNLVGASRLVSVCDHQCGIANVKGQ